MEVPVAGTICRLDLEFFCYFDDFYYFLDPLEGAVLGKKEKKRSVKKDTKNMSNIFMQAMQLIPRLVPCGPLKELKKSAILRDWPQQLAIGNWYSH